MKVMKFGGTSVGSVESILNLKRIVEAEEKPVVVVVSALGGITDKLLGTSRLALNGDDGWRQEFEAIKSRHFAMTDALFAGSDKHDTLSETIGAFFRELESIYYGVYLIHDLSAKTEAAIVSYGERLSSHIVAALVDGGIRMNSRDFIRTVKKQGKHILDAEMTYQLVREAFSSVCSCTTATNGAVAVVPGFISRDRDTKETTNLGRGGSDYTAAIIAAALDAEVLEIWTDVDGFMTADPRVIKTASTINELSSTIILYTGGTSTISAAIYTTLFADAYGPAAALSTILTASTILALMLFNRISGGKSVGSGTAPHCES